MPLASGTKLGPYEIQSPLGAGGMGEVYRASDTRLDRTVAVKILPSHLSENDQAKQRFDREARAISSLNHPNICTLYDVGSQGSVDYLVMEFLEGETLADRLRKGPLTAGQLLTFGPNWKGWSVWSPDAKFIAYGVEAAGKVRIVRKPSDGSGAEETLLTLGPEISTSTVVDWSPDGRYLSYDAYNLNEGRRAHLDSAPVR
jgi:hypothetical protein